MLLHRKPRVSVIVRAMLAAAVLALFFASAGAPARGQDRGGVVRVMRESRDFRARTRAALALGASADPTMSDALAGALRDPHPAVRAAAAQGLGRLGTRTQIAALRLMARDAERSVRDAATSAIAAIETRYPATPAPTTRPTTPSPIAPPVAPAAAPPVAELPLPRINWARTQIVVVLGSMENRSGYAHPPLAAMLRNEVLRSLGSVRGVGILPDVPNEDADREIRRRRIRRYRLEGSIRHVTPEAPPRLLRVRCEVGVMVLDDPGHNLRAALDGAATGTEPVRAQNRTQQEHSLAEQALQGAVRSAMNGAAQALQRSGGGR